ncbi:MAG: transketolase [Spirochaetales bacterium]|nr:transketolase [Spirochaetales bacterium]
MGISEQDFNMLEDKARELRKLTVQTVSWAGGGHIGGALSATDILTMIYYKYARVDVKNPKWEDRDRVIVSKGHIGVGYAPVLADKGFFDKEWLKTYNHTESKLGMHLDVNKVPGLDASSGSLGHGLSIALGNSLGAKLLKKDINIYVIMGDGECDEGSIWEAAMAISHFKATNVIPIVDRNRCMIDGPTEEVMKLEPFADKWRAFGFDVVEIDGHNMYQIAEAFDKAKAAKDKPVVIIANTFKGCGISWMQDKYEYHYASIDASGVEKSVADIDAYHDARKAKGGK